MTNRILVVDDDWFVNRLAAITLQIAGYEILNALDGRDGLRIFHAQDPDLVILDLMMPELSGWEVCQQIRAVSNTPIIMLTAKNARDDVIRGLASGADDYVVKPFEPQELTARVRAVLRRTQSQAGPKHERMLTLDQGRMIINLANHQVFKDGQPLLLTATEYKLLFYLASNAGRLLTTEQIHQHVWSGDNDTGLDSVRWYVWRLRDKLERDPNAPALITTERGVGYRFTSL